MASQGYPGEYSRGEPVAGLERELATTPGPGHRSSLGETGPASSCDAPDPVKVFHAGTRLEGGRVLTAGGRVLCVCALGEDARSAAALAYRRVESISWPHACFRRDIGHHAMEREVAEPVA